MTRGGRDRADDVIIPAPDPVQPAERGGPGQPEEEADHTAAAGHRLLLRADEPGEQRRRTPAAGLHPNCSGPAEDEA